MRYIVQSCPCIVTQTDKREAWSGKHVDTPEVCSAAQRGAARDRWLQGTAGVASLPADVPFVFRHWNVDDASPWHLYMLQYRADYTYRRLGVTHSASADSDSATGRRAAARDACDARHSADSDGQTAIASTRQQRSERAAVKWQQGRAGHRSAPASFSHQRPAADELADTDTVNVTTVSLQLPTAAAAKSLLRCPAIRVNLNGASSAVPHSAVTSLPQQAPPPSCSVLPRVIAECADGRTHQHQHNHHHHHQHHQQVAGTTSDSYSSFIGRTMRQVPSNGFSIDDRTMSVAILSSCAFTS